MVTGQRRTGMSSASWPYWKFRGNELQSATVRSASLDHESGTVCLLLFVTLTHLRASGNRRKRFCSLDDHGAGDAELAPLNELNN